MPLQVAGVAGLVAGSIGRISYRVMFYESDSSVKWCIIRAASYSSFAGTAAKHNSPGASHRLLAQAWRSSFSGCESRQKPRLENAIQIPL